MGQACSSDSESDLLRRERVAGVRLSGGQGGWERCCLGSLYGMVYGWNESYNGCASLEVGVLGVRHCSLGMMFA